MEEIKDFTRSRTAMNLFIVLVNVAVYAWLDFGGSTESAEYMAAHGASWTPYIQENGEYYRLFTSLFLHFGLEHLLNNMLVLLFVGNTLERMVGKVRYLLIYLLGGLGGNLLSYGAELYTQDYAVSAGASGAVFAVIGALLFLMITRKESQEEGYTWSRLVLMAGLTLIQGFTTTGVDNMAHLGGLLSGFLLAILLCGWQSNRKNRSMSQG